MTEIWRKIEHPHTDNYEVSSYGRVRSKARDIAVGYENRGLIRKEETILKPKVREGDPDSIRITYRNPETGKAAQVGRTIPSLVYTAFVGEIPPGHIVRLVEGRDMRPENLRLVSRRELLEMNGAGRRATRCK